MMLGGAWPLLLTLAACLAGGVLLGVAYFCAVRRTAELVTAGFRPLSILALGVGRLVLLIGGFLLVLQLGGAVILALLGGVLIGRSLVLRRVGGDANDLSP